MKNQILQNFQILLLAAWGNFFFAPHADANSSVAPSNRTNAPGHGTCATCHGGPGGGSVTISLSDATAYTAGEMYQLMVTVSDPGKQRFGFSMVARDADNNTVDVGTWAADGDNTTTHGPGGNHVGHRAAPRVADSFTFTVNWTAPATGVGDVTFYAVGNGANGNGSTSGDNIYNTTLTIGEAVAAPTPATLTDLFREPDGTSKFTLTGGADETFTLEFSEDLDNWSPLETRTLGSPSEQVTDPGAIGKARRFYRATPGAPGS
jgi:hypothetical protein